MYFTECEDHTEVASNQSKSSFSQTTPAPCSFGYIIGITCFVNANWNTSSVSPDGDTGECISNLFVQVSEKAIC